jgi:UDP-2,3-diacylglucosamine hydrolase
MSAAAAPRLARAAPGAPPVPCTARSVLLFTDLHLDAQRPQECAAFAASLRALTPRAPGAAVVVMGDLFDAYAGPEDWELPPFAPLLEAGRALAAAGARVVLLRGNRDVMLEPAHLPAAAGIEVTDSLLCRLPGRAPTLVTHGDAFCLADRRYQFLRRTLRRPRLRRFLLRRGIGARRWLAGRLRGVSRGELARKPLADLEVTPTAVAAVLAELGAAQAVIGHLHVRRSLALAGGGILRILPAWEPNTPAWDLASVLDAAV